MFAPELAYTDCTDPTCHDRKCTPCGLGITSCCRGTVACQSTRETHPCATRHVDWHANDCPVCPPNRNEDQ